MKVLVHIAWPVKAWSIGDAHVAELRRRFPDVEFVHVHTREEVTPVIGDVDAAFAPFLSLEMLAAAKRLRWVHSSAAAVEGLLPLRELAARGIVVTNSRGVQAVPMAEHVMGGLLVLARKFDRMLDAQRAHRWIQNDLTEDWPWTLHGRRMTIVGLGTIGMEVARRAHAFGMYVTGIRRRAGEPRPDFVERVLPPESLDDSLRDCDVLVLAAPGIASTKGMIRAEQLALLNRGAVLVNVARGAVVDEAAMIAALDSGQLGGAVLDVFDAEPLDARSRLWDMKNVIISPHSSGFRAAHWDIVIDLFSANLAAFIEGREPTNRVNAVEGY